MKKDSNLWMFIAIAICGCVLMSIIATNAVGTFALVYSLKNTPESENSFSVNTIPANNYSNTNYQNKQSNMQGNQSVKEPQRINLTAENVNDYLFFTASAHDCEVNEEALDYLMGQGYLRLKASRKSNVTFENVSVTLTVGESEDRGWQKVNHTMQISADGIAEEDFTIHGMRKTHLSDTPLYNSIVVTDASGTVIIN